MIDIKSIKLTSYSGVFFTIINEGYLNFAKNFCQRLQQLNIVELFNIICTDVESYNELKKCNYGCAVLYDNSVVPKTFEVWKTVNYKSVVFNKLDITKEVLSNIDKIGGTHIIYIDTDIWVYNNFLSELFKILTDNPTVDLFLQDGRNYQDIDVDNIQTYSQTNDRVNLCTGFMMLRNTANVIKILDYKKNTSVDWKKHVGNQSYFNDCIRAFKITAFTIPIEYAVNGSVVDKFNKEKSWLLHYNYIIGITKMLKMQENQHWVLDNSSVKPFKTVRGGKPELYVKCDSGFANQLRMMLAGTILLQSNCISTFNQEWVMSNHNNVDYNTFFKPLPMINMTSLNNVEQNRIITTTSFEGLLAKYNTTSHTWQTLLQKSLLCLTTQECIQQIVQQYIVRNNITDAIGVHARRTCKLALLEIEHDRYLPFSNTDVLNMCTEDSKVFVATDNSETQTFFKDALQDNFLSFAKIQNGTEKFVCDVYDSNKVSRYTSGLHTVIDFLILKQCKRFIGSSDSSFSLLLYYWRNNNLDVPIFGKI